MTGISGIWVRCRYQVPDLSVRNRLSAGGTRTSNSSSRFEKSRPSQDAPQRFRVVRPVRAVPLLHTLNLRGFRHAAVEGAEHQVLLTVSIEAQADERCSVELLSAILALNRALHPDG